MPVFYYHPQNAIPKQLVEMTGKRGFLYSNRNELELILQRQLIDLGHGIDPRFHTIVSTIAGSIDIHIQLNPDDELDRHALALCKQKSPWNYIKVLNGKDMMFIMGYVSAGGDSPFGMGVVQAAQKGLTSATYIPRPV
jgi:hypothetical protein